MAAHDRERRLGASGLIVTQRRPRPTGKLRAGYLAAHAKLCGSSARCTCGAPPPDGQPCRRCGRLVRDGAVIQDGERLVREVAP